MRFESGDTLSATNFTLDPDGRRITLGEDDSIFIADGDEGIQLGDATFADAPFSVTTAGVLKAESGNIGGFTITDKLSAGSGDNLIELIPATPKIRIGAKASLTDSNTGVHIGSDGIALGASSVFKVTKAGVLKAESGTIGGFTLSTNALTATNFTLDPNNQKITLGSFNNIFIANADVGIQLGHGTFASAPFSVTKAGVLKSTSGTIGGFTITTDAISKTIVDGNGDDEFKLLLNTSGDPALEFHSQDIAGNLQKTMFISSTEDDEGEYSSIISASNAIMKLERTFAYGSGGSFTAGNKVLMSDNTYKNIEDIEENDMVVSYHVVEQKLYNSSVKSLITHSDKSYYIINNKLEATPNHKIYTLSGWKKVSELQVNDELLNENLEVEVITSIEFVEDDVDVYDISLNGKIKNYFIENIFVHNATQGSIPGGGETSPGYLVGINTITGISNYSGSANGQIRTAGVAGLSKGGYSTDAQDISRIEHIGLYGSSSNAYNHYSGYFAGGDVFVEQNITGSSNLAITGKAVIGSAGYDIKNTLSVYHNGFSGDQGIMIIRDDTSTTNGNILGGIGFDSTDGNVPSSILQASTYIASYATGSHGSSNKGGYLTFGTSPFGQAEQTTSVEAMRITDNGTILIGRTSALATRKDPLLEIDGAISFDGFLSRAGITGTDGGDASLPDNGGLTDLFSDNGNHRLNFFWDGSNLESWVEDVFVFQTAATFSDYRIKDNVTQMEDGVLDKINKIKPIHYTQKAYGDILQEDTGSIKTSILAHELQEIFPDMVIGEKDAVKKDGTPALQHFNDKALTLYLVKAVQELSKKVDSLEAQISGSN